MFGSELIAMRIACDLLEVLRYKLRFFGIEVHGECGVYCDNNSFVKCSQRPDSRISNRHNAICFHSVSECVAKLMIRVSKEDRETNIADIFTKALRDEKRRDILRCIFVKGGDQQR